MKPANVIPYGGGPAVPMSQLGAGLLMGTLGALMYLLTKTKKKEKRRMETDELLAVMAASIMGGPGGTMDPAKAVALAGQVLTEVDKLNLAGLQRERERVRGEIAGLSAELGKLGAVADNMKSTIDSVLNPPPAPAPRAGLPSSLFSSPLFGGPAGYPGAPPPSAPGSTAPPAAPNPLGSGPPV